MKNKQRSKLLNRSMLSFITLIIFSLLAVGSWDYFWFGSSVKKPVTEEIRPGVWQETAVIARGRNQVTTGEKDSEGRWHGSISIDAVNVEGHIVKTEGVKEHGNWHGIVKISTEMEDDVFVETYTYNMGKLVDETKSAQSIPEEITSFQFLKLKYPIFLKTLNVIAYDNNYVELYLNQIDSMLVKQTFEDFEEDFDDFYDASINVLAETPFDSIKLTNELLSYYTGIELVKDAEIRLAVIDRYRSEGKSTYQILNDKYKNYLIPLIQGEITLNDVELFCEDLDSCLNSYGPLDKTDSYFLDSIDARIFRSLFFLISTDGMQEELTFKSATLNNYKILARSILSKISIDAIPLKVSSSSSEVAAIVLLQIFQLYASGDIIKYVVKESYQANNYIARLSQVTTVFLSSTSSTSVLLRGTIIDDGGATISASGIVWATHFNPVIDDNTESANVSTGNFEITLKNLVEEVTYYARTFATNTEGTAYGNCISFKVGQNSLNHGSKAFKELEIKIFPNPATNWITVNFQHEYSEQLRLQIIDIKGQVVLTKLLWALAATNNQEQLDVSSLASGFYSCQLLNSETVIGRQNLIIK